MEVNGHSVTSKFLVFEDDGAIRGLIQDLLAMKGLASQSYDHPIIELAQPHDCSAPDAPCKGIEGIISDVDMPQLDGITFFEHLFKTECRLKQSTLILMSARPRGVSQACPVRFMAKPFQVADFFSAINH